MMKKLVAILVVVFSVAACSPLKNIKRPVVYKSERFWPLTAQYDLEIVFYPDYTFEYIIQGDKDYDIRGTWELQKDMVILHSEKFFEKTILRTYRFKYTNANAGTDIYLMRRNILYEIAPEKVKLLTKASKKHMERLMSK